MRQDFWLVDILGLDGEAGPKASTSPTAPTPTPPAPTTQPTDPANSTTAAAINTNATLQRGLTDDELRRMLCQLAVVRMIVLPDTLTDLQPAWSSARP